MEKTDENDIFEDEGVAVETALPPKENNEKPTQEQEDVTTLLNRLKITVGDPEKRTKNTGLKMQETFVVYLIETVPHASEENSTSEEVTSLWRRYSEFELLRNYLVVTYSSVIIPPLPEKRANFIWTKISSTDTYDAEFLERRRAGLESFLHRICSHPRMAQDEFIKHFITKQEGWRDAMLASGFQNKADSWLKKTNASMRVKHPDIRFEQLKAYANHLQSVSSNLLKVRAKIAERVYGIYKIHGNYARVFKEWALVEDSPMKEALQKSSMEVEKWSNSIDVLIDEEDLIAEQLKEYLYFADSLKNLCKKHEAMQYDVEWYENQMMLSMAEKKRLLTGNVKSFSLSGMKAKLFGGDSAEQTESKIEQLDKAITDLEKKLEEHKAGANKFLEEALSEIESFKKRKIADLREIFISYAILQIKIHKEGSTIWSRFKAIFDGVLAAE